MIVEKLDPSSGAILFKEDEESLLIKRLEKKIEELEKRVDYLENKL